MELIDNPRFVRTDLAAPAVLETANQRGYSPERLFKGLGFTKELRDANPRASCCQASQLTHRAQQTLKVHALVLTVGPQLAITYSGLPGLIMQTCRTFGEFIRCGICCQNEIGALTHELPIEGGALAITTTPKSHAPSLVSFFIDESFANPIATLRYKIDQKTLPIKVKFSYLKTQRAKNSSTYFQHPTNFSHSQNILATHTNWIDEPTPAFDETSSYSPKLQPTGPIHKATHHDESPELHSMYLHMFIDQTPGAKGFASQLSVSEQTLSRQLAFESTSFQQILDRVRHSSSLELLNHTKTLICEISLVLEFCSTKNFRRVFVRWAGVVPSGVRPKRIVQNNKTWNDIHGMTRAAMKGVEFTLKSSYPQAIAFRLFHKSTLLNHAHSKHYRARKWQPL